MPLPERSNQSQRPFDHATLAEALRRSRQTGIVLPPDGLFSNIAIRETSRALRSPWILRAGFAFPVAAAIVVGVFLFVSRDRNPARASQAVSQSLSFLPRTSSGMTDLVLEPVRHEARTFLQDTRRATESFQRAFPRVY